MSSIVAYVEIAKVCLIYLLELGLSGSKLNQAFLKEYLLAQFAVTYWYYHYRKTENSTEELDACILRLFQSQTLFATWVRLHNVDVAFEPYFSKRYNSTRTYSLRVDKIPAPIYYTSLLGLDKVLHRLLPSEQVESTKISVPSLTTSPKASKQAFSAAGRHGGALHTAAYHGYDHIIQILLDSGFDINDQGERRWGSALCAASSHGHAKVVKILLDRGVDVDFQSYLYVNALEKSSHSGNKEVVQLLLDRGADVNAAQSRDFGSAVQQASASGYKEIVQMLLDRGADVNTQRGPYASALQEA